MSRRISRIDVCLIALRQASRSDARRAMRGLLAAQLGCAAEEVRIVRGPTGKPALAGGELEFSFSHRDRWCAVAFSRDCSVGVDVEPIRPISGMAEVVRQFFPPVASADFAAAAPGAQLTVFFRWWTRIEAAVKARGVGLDASTSCFDGVLCRSSDAVPGLALAVAARTPGPVEIRWSLPAASLRLEAEDHVQHDGHNREDG